MGDTSSDTGSAFTLGGSQVGDESKSLGDLTPAYWFVAVLTIILIGIATRDFFKK